MMIVEGEAAIGTEKPPTGARAFADVDAFVAELADIGRRYGCAVQALDARYVASRAHLERAVEHANRSVARGENVADKRAVEILCYAAGTRQIDDALAIGVTPGITLVVVLVDEGRLGVPASEAPLDGPGDEEGAAAAVAELLGPAETLGEAEEEAIMRVFEVSEVERQATSADLEDLVSERVALLDVEK